MITQFDKLEKEKIIGLKGGVGIAYKEVLPITDNNIKMFARITLTKNASIGFHKHDTDYEIVYILSGNPTVKLEDGSLIVLHPNDIHYCKNQESHSIMNLTDDDVSFIGIVVNN